MSSNVYTGKQAQEQILRGIKEATTPIRLSYGPKGGNALIEDTLYPGHQIANDAQTIIQAIHIQSNHIDDTAEKLGLGLLKELSDKADKDSGDGRKTTLIIAETILEEGFKSDNPLQLKRDLDALLPLVESKIDEYKQDISAEDVHKVATIAGESEEIGNIVGDIYKKIGKDGIVNVEGSGTYTTSVSYIEGVRFIDTGYLSPYMVHDETAEKEGKKPTKAIYYNPTILVTKRKIQSVKDIDPLLQALLNHPDGKKDLVIFTDDMDSSVAQMLVALHQAKKMNVLIIKAPVLWKQYVFEDFAKVTGSTIVEDATGLTFKNLPLSALGTCGKIVVDREETIVIDGADITDHIQFLKEENTNDSKLRLSWLTTKTAILKLGAGSESELSWKRLKTHDAIHSARLALMDGVVLGGGLTLFKLANVDFLDKSILSLALQAPVHQLAMNNKQELDEYLSSFDKIEKPMDAAIVVKNAIRNAVSLAGTALTTQILITLPKKSKEEMELEILQAKQRPF